jgi:histidinol-phosphatase (PHP family)
MCGHAEGEMEEYVEKAVKIGLTEIGFAGHFPLLHINEPNLAISSKEFPLYLEKINKLKVKFSPYPIKLGIEVDYLPQVENHLRALLSNFDFDYIYGSVHFVDDWMIDHPRHRERFLTSDIYKVYCDYFHLIEKASQSKLFDILAHFDLVKKFGYKPRQDITPVLKKTLEVVKHYNLVIEINTAGLRKPVKEIYPKKQILELAYKFDIPVTIGSDAHKPQEVGYEFTQVKELLSEIGYREIVTFEKRQRKAMSLDES